LHPSTHSFTEGGVRLRRHDLILWASLITGTIAVAVAVLTL